jgi:hypothetical protein
MRDSYQDRIKKETHISDGFPHKSSITGLCMCLDACCQGEKGCKCKSCICQIVKKSHDEFKSQSISANTTLLRGMVGVNSGIPEMQKNGGKRYYGKRMAVFHKMKIRIVINTMTKESDSERRSEVWSGEIDIIPEDEYLTKISLIADGINNPICDIPFSVMTGHYQWIPPYTDDERLEEIEESLMKDE